LGVLVRACSKESAGARGREVGSSANPITWSSERNGRSGSVGKEWEESLVIEETVGRGVRKTSGDRNSEGIAGRAMFGNVASTRESFPASRTRNKGPEDGRNLP